jgi:hypothetical protein
MPCVRTRPKRIALSLYRTLFAAVVGVGLIATPALAERPRDRDPASVQPRVQPRAQSRDQDRAFEAARAGRSMTLPDLKRRVMPLMEGADYFGSDKIGDGTRLKFMRGDRLIWVDVDGSGRILRRSRP